MPESLRRVAKFSLCFFALRRFSGSQAQFSVGWSSELWLKELLLPPASLLITFHVYFWIVPSWHLTTGWPPPVFGSVFVCSGWTCSAAFQLPLNKTWIKSEVLMNPRVGVQLRWVLFWQFCPSVVTTLFNVWDLKAWCGVGNDPSAWKVNKPVKPHVEKRLRRENDSVSGAERH